MMVAVQFDGIHVHRTGDFAVLVARFDHQLGSNNNATNKDGELLVNVLL